MYLELNEDSEALRKRSLSAKVETAKYWSYSTGLVEASTGVGHQATLWIRPPQKNMGVPKNDFIMIMITIPIPFLIPIPIMMVKKFIIITD